jgi:hypothetical protein
MDLGKEVQVFDRGQARVEARDFGQTAMRLRTSSGCSMTE